MITSTQSLTREEFDSINFNPNNTSTQKLDRGWSYKMGEEVQNGFPAAEDYVVKGPLKFKVIRNIYTGNNVTVLVDPAVHNGYVTEQQHEAYQCNLLLGSGVRISLEGNIGSGTTAPPFCFAVTLLC